MRTESINRGFCCFNLKYRAFYIDMPIALSHFLVYYI